MKLLIQSAMIFFGTLMAAAVVALGEPAKSDLAVTASASFAAERAGQNADGTRGQRGRLNVASHKQGYQVR